LAVGLCAAIVFFVTGQFASASSTSRTVTGTAPGCTARLTTTATEASITVIKGCSSNNYWLSSWSAPSDIPGHDHPQQLYKVDGTAPYSVLLPPCFWQVDFAERSSPPGNAGGLIHYVVGLLGGTQCVSTTTTTVPGVTTTSEPSTPPTTTGATTTTTTTSGGGTTTTTTTVPGGGTTTTTAPGSSGTTTTSTTGPGIKSLQGTTTTVAPGSATTVVGGGLPTSGSSSGPPLAFTGANIVKMVMAGIIAIALGLIIVDVASERRRNSALRRQD
jgi:hypothetical protein